MHPDSIRRCKHCRFRLPLESFDVSPQTNKPFTNCRSCRKQIGRIVGVDRPNPNPGGLCRCGCGERTTIAQKHSPTKNHVQGFPTHFIHGHEQQVRVIQRAAQGLRHCCDCKQERPIGEFSRNRVQKDGLSHVCRSCDAARKKTGAQERLTKNTKVVAHLLAKGCVVCGATTDAGLAFHHRDSTTKEENVSRLLRSAASPERIMREVSRCVVLCNRCHRKVHHGTASLPG